ncbi:MAG: M20/M25/M40 family metallo-hydrolase [Pyrinomonadaceae bacterium]|nr:M20/M25/M40 family metallo-hydrolase [Pyrinomonadaceae bacterium]
MRRNLFAILLLATFVFQSTALAQTAPVKISPAEKKAAEGVTAAQLKDYLYFVASDEMEGRDTPSRGLDITAKFIGMNLSRWGFKPAGDNGTFYQMIALKRDSVDPAATSVEVGGQKFSYGDDIVRVSGNTNGTLSGPIVYAGNGWMVKSKGLNPYANIDVKGKFIAVYSDGPSSGRNLVAMPAGVTQADLSGERGKDWADATTYARANGALGVIVVASGFLADNWGMVTQMFGRTRMSVEKLAPAMPPQAAGAPNVFIVSKKLANAIFDGESGSPLSGATNSFDLSSAKKFNFSIGTKTETAWTQNVVALWEGSDPTLKSEMVAIGAHYDHVGINPNAPGPDKVFNGADDDGSGTVAVLSIAEALAEAGKRPKRSILFVWHTGEEKGLWGSDYFNKFPTVDIKKVVAQLNIDMIGRSKKAGDTNPKNKDLSGENTIYVIGADMMSSTLGSVVKGTNTGYLNMEYDYRYDDPKDTNRFFFRSDHFNYALNGIPVAFWFDGVHEDYHGAGDHADKIDYARMEKISRTIFLTMWKLGELKDRPKVDKTLPPELTQR